MGVKVGLRASVEWGRVQCGEGKKTGGREWRKGVWWCVCGVCMCVRVCV